MTTADNAATEQDLPEDSEAPSSPESVAPETEADTREREIQRRLTASGREAAEARRQAAAAQQALANQTAQIGELQASIRLLNANLSERDKRDAEERAQQIEAELASLPPADRLERKIELLQGQITSLQTAAPRAQPVPAASPPAPPPPSPNGAGIQESTDQERAAYMERRVREIIQEATDTFGVAVDLDDVPDADWDAEDTFYKSVMKQAALAARGNGGASMPRKPAAETPAQMRDRIRQEERERLGVNSPAAPRAAPAGRKKAPTAEDVRAGVQSYDSKLGPKANVARLKELRSSMG